jgi:hypothetical protein
MHTRRLGAFLIGAWLVGGLLMGFVTSQSLRTVDRILAHTPQPDVSRLLLRHQALEFNRHVTEAWEVMQLGIGAALLATSILTSHRSRIVIASTTVMLLIVVCMHFGLSPHMRALERSYDFLPPNAAAEQRDTYQSYAVWYLVLEILKVLAGLVTAGRLLLDRYDWRAKLFGAPMRTRHRKHRRLVTNQVNTIDHAHNRHVDG